MTRDDIKRDITLLFKDAEKFENRCDTRLFDTLPELKLKIESLADDDDYSDYINKFYEIRDGFKLDCMCGKKARLEIKGKQETEFEASEKDISWFGDHKRRIEEVMKYHRGGK